MSTEHPLSPQQLTRSSARRMDCMDCHNRPSHAYQPPDRAVDQAFETHRLDGTLPYLKREAVRLLMASYASESEALTKIRHDLQTFYAKEYPSLSSEQSTQISRAADEIGRIYAANMFPEMHADWRAYPNHLGHLNSDGCFRCHDGLHKSLEGKIITKDCNACHTLLAQGTPAEVATAKLEEQPFRHPVDLGGDVTEMKCSQCHTGTSGL